MAAIADNTFSPGMSQMSPEQATTAPLMNRSLDSADAIIWNQALLFGCVRKHGQNATALDRRSEHPLMPGAVARYPARDNFAPFGYKSFQHSIVFIIDKACLAFAKTANFPSPSFH
jgi:hypothetical protein